MEKGHARVHAIEQKTQKYGSSDPNQDHMISTLHFTLQVGTKVHDMCVEVRHPFGTDYKSMPFEVDRPTGGYRGALNHEDLQTICEKSLRSELGSSGFGIRIDGATNVVLEGNVFYPSIHGDIRIAEAGPGPW